MHTTSTSTGQMESEIENRQKGKGGPDADVVDFLFVSLLFPFSFFRLNFRFVCAEVEDVQVFVFYTRL